MISNKNIKAEHPNIEFYYEDIMDYIKKHKMNLDLENNSKHTYNEILKNEYQKYTILGQKIWNQYSHNEWKQIWNNTFFSYCWPENNNILYIVLHYSTRTNDHIYRWTNQKHLKNPNCKLCNKEEDIIHHYIFCKRNKRIWKHFQRYYHKLTQKDYTALEHILTHFASSLLSKTNKLFLMITNTILTHIWKTRNRLQFDDTIISTTNTVINVTNDLKNIIHTHYKKHFIQATLHEFKTNFCINDTLCTLTNDSLTILL